MGQKAEGKEGPRRQSGGGGPCKTPSPMSPRAGGCKIDVRVCPCVLRMSAAVALAFIPALLAGFCWRLHCCNLR